MQTVMGPLPGNERRIDLDVQPVARLEHELIELREQANAAIAAVHREHRRDLVPLEQSIVRWERRPGSGPRRS